MSASGTAGARAPGSPAHVDPGPFAFEGDAARGAAALCLHGLTGTPYEVRSLGEALASRGIAAFGPALPGHHETPEALARIASHAVWLDAAREHVRALRARHERVFAVGLSMGGLLSLALAAEGAVDAVVAVGTPLRLPLPIRLVAPWIWRLRPFQPKGGGSDIQDAAARERHPSYPVMPIRSVAVLLGLQREVRAGLSRIRVPILVAHGALDRTARPSDAERIVARVASAEKRLLVLQRSGHVVPVDLDGPDLARQAAEFLAARLAGPAAEGRAAPG
jgi:carboxylesterase